MARQGTGKAGRRLSGLVLPLRDGRDQRVEGLRGMRAGRILLSSGKRQEAEKLLRAALSDLVFAFLLDRQGNAQLFTVAHRVGALIENEFGCKFVYDPETDAYMSDCPIAGLHSRLGMSAAFTTASTCSICGAEDFDCSHVPGRLYEDELCRRRDVRLIAIREISMTPNPDFAETFVQHVDRPRSDFEAEANSKIPRGAVIYNHHCRNCSGVPSAEDLDPRLWQASERATDV